MKPRPASRVASLERTQIRRLFDEAPADAINLGLGQPDLPTPAVVCLEGVRGIVGQRTGYTTTAGDPRLRAAVAAEYPGFAEGIDSVVVHVGSQQALFCAVAALCDAGQELLYPDPGYPAYPTLATLVGAVPVPYRLRPERGFRLDPADIEDRLTAETAAVILCSPGNPTGAVHGAAEIERLTAVLDERGVAWISDEIYRGFSYVGDVPSPSRHSRGGVVVSGLSKTHAMTGWRIGWAVTEPELARRITALHQHVATCAPSISQAAALAAFGPAGREAAESYRRLFARRRALMREELAALGRVGFEPPDGAFYFFVRIDGETDTASLSRRILERERVITIPGVAFGAGGEGHLRLSFAASEQSIRAGIRAVGRVLDSGG